MFITQLRIEDSMIGLCSTHPEPDLWFPEQPQGKPSQASRKRLAKQVLLAVSICQECPVKQECLAEGMKPENIDYGIWGGVLAGERIVASGMETKYAIRRDAIVFAEGVKKWQSILQD